MRGCFEIGKSARAGKATSAGRVTLEDGRVYYAGVTVKTTPRGEEYLSIYLRPDLSTLLKGITPAN
jgi:hypothetical protein